MQSGGIATLPGGLDHLEMSVQSVSSISRPAGVSFSAFNSRLKCPEVGVTKGDGELLDQRMIVHRASSSAAVHFVDPI